MNPTQQRSGLAALPELDRAVLLFLNDNPRARVEAVADGVSLSVGAARSRLSQLENQGFVTHASGARNGERGRPTYLYSVAPAAYGLFPSGHTFTLQAVLGILKRDHPDTYADVFEKLHVQFYDVGLLPEALIRYRPADRLRRLLPWTELYGQRTTGDVDETGGQYVVSYCPALDIATRHRGMCESEQRWLSAFFPEFDVEITQTLATGAARCVLTLRAAGKAEERDGAALPEQHGSTAGGNGP